MQHRPPLKLEARNLGDQFFLTVASPKALSQCCLELALLVSGQANAFTAVCEGEWEGTVWFGVGADVDEGIRMRQEEGRVLSESSFGT